MRTCHADFLMIANILSIYKAKLWRIIFVLFTVKSNILRTRLLQMFRYTLQTRQKLIIFAVFSLLELTAYTRFKSSLKRFLRA